MKDKHRKVRASSFKHNNLMKRFFLSLFAIVFTCLCFAQDIIVLKDGSTLLARVTKVTQSVVEYKKFNNLTGPDYTISTKELQCINYENGTKDTFVSPNENPNTVTNENTTQPLSDNILDFYRKDPVKQLRNGKIMKYSGFALTGIGTLASIALFATSCDGSEDILAAAIPFVVGAGIGVPLIFMGNKKIRNNRLYVQSTHIYQQEFTIGKNERLLVGLDMLKDNSHNNQTVGLGVSYNF